MDRVHVRRIAPHERRALQRMKWQKRNRVNCDHARIILLSSGRVGNRQIAFRVGCTPQWVRKIIHRFNTAGIPAIEWYPYFQLPRRPYTFTADLLEEIVTVALSPPIHASWLNWIESQFTALKKFALENSDFRTHEEQQEAIASYLRWRNGCRDISIEAWSRFRKRRRAA